MEMCEKDNFINNFLGLVVTGFVFVCLFKSPQLNTFIWAITVLYGVFTPVRLHLQNIHNKEDN